MGNVFGVWLVFQPQPAWWTQEALDIPQIQREGKLATAFDKVWLHRAGRVAGTKKARVAAALGLVGVHREGGGVASAGVHNVVSAAADTAAVPGVHDVEYERRVDADSRVQATRRLPRTVADAGDIFGVGAGRVQRDCVAAG